MLGGVTLMTEVDAGGGGVWRKGEFAGARVEVEFGEISEVAWLRLQQREGGEESGDGSGGAEAMQSSQVALPSQAALQSPPRRPRQRPRHSIMRTPPLQKMQNPPPDGEIADGVRADIQTGEVYLKYL